MGHNDPRSSGEIALSTELPPVDTVSVAVIGLGYVGLPLAIEFGKRYPTIGFDTKESRIAELYRGEDGTLEVGPEEFALAERLSFTDDPAALSAANVYIVTVPTPIDQYKRPDLAALRAASRTVGEVISAGDVVIYESTVYPGATEEVCIPVVEEASGLVFNRDFYGGYSPERINPGDKAHRLPDITKVTSGSTPEAAEFVDALYASIIRAGTHRTSSIRVAEAAKVIENTQRDLNIALVNELALIFDKLDLDSSEVLQAAGTKWNFLDFKPGLVGGHCIGVDPYYLTFKAQEVGYHPEVILAGRRINDGMGEHIADRLLKLMTREAINVVGSRVLVLGLAFKQNCPDVRNTRVIDVIRALETYNIQVDVHDPWVDRAAACSEFGIKMVEVPAPASYDAAVLAVPHDQFIDLGSTGIREFLKDQHVLFDVKSVLPRADVSGRL
jgi:UDP-N-acetyl-D-galactosamine dehydrogenase